MKVVILNEKNGNRLEEYQNSFLYFFKLTKEDLEKDMNFKNESSLYFRNPDKLKKIIFNYYKTSNKFFNGFSCSQFAGRVAAILVLNNVAFNVYIGLEQWNNKDSKDKLINLMNSDTFNSNHVWLISDNGTIYEHNGIYDKVVYYLGYFEYSPNSKKLKSKFSEQYRKILKKGGTKIWQ